MRKIAILGSTGSIGTQALDIVRRNRDIAVSAMSCASNIALFEEQIREFKPKLAVVATKEGAELLRERIRDVNCELLWGMEGLLAAAGMAETELVLTAVVGMIGIEPTLAAIAAGKDIALANKESLCCAGHLIMPAAREKGVKILPVDSEHSAIFQCLQGNGGNKIRRLLLTASGGPFRGYTKEQLAKVSPAQALRHPNWAMGKKITIDSSTMANKGLELMEARWLFDVAPENIEVVVQPQSVIHSMVEYEDGSVLAQLGTPDMRLPIQYALYYPERRFLEGERLDFFKLKNLHFEEADTEVFEALALARRAICCGGSMPTVFNAANEYAVALFLEEKIQYPDICRLIRTAMDRHRNIPTPSLQDILHTKEEVEACLSECL